MNNNGYGHMGQMMEPVGREGGLLIRNLMDAKQGSSVYEQLWE